MNKILNILIGLLILIVSIVAVILIPGFKELFIDLGAELPVFTRMVIDSYLYWWILIIFPILMHIMMTRSVKLAQSTFLTKVFIIILVLLFLLIPFIIYVLYLPIFIIAQ